MMTTMKGHEKTIRTLKRRRLRITILSLAALFSLGVVIYSCVALRQFEEALPAQWFKEQLSQEGSLRELPIVLSEMHQISTLQSYLAAACFFHLALFGFLFGALLVEIFASRLMLKVAMWERIDKMERELADLKQSQNAAPFVK